MPQPDEARYTQGPVGRHVLHLILTSWVSMLAVYAVEFLSLFYLGQLRQPELLSALGFVAMTQFVLMSLSIGLSIGGSVGASRAWGAGQAQQAREVGGASLALVAGLAVLGGGLYLGLLRLALPHLGFSAPVQALVWQQALWTTPSLLGAGLGMMAANLLRAGGHPQPAMWVLLLGTGLVAVLDPWFLFGLDWGLDGVALAMGLSRTATALVGLWVLVHLGLVARPRGESARTARRTVLGVALPAGLTIMATPVAVIFTVVTFAREGDQIMAGVTVIDRVIQLAFCLFFTLPSALGPVLGQNLGASRPERVREAVAVAHTGTLAYGLVVALALTLLAPWVPGWFQVQGDAAELVVFFCRWGSWSWAVTSAFFVAISAFNSLGQPGRSLALSWLRASVGTVPFVLLGSHWGGATGVVAGQSLGFALFAGLAWWWCQRLMASLPAHTA